MGIEEALFESSLEPDKMQDILFYIPKYIKKTGGGIYWTILYWILYATFAQEIIRRQEKLDYIAIGALIFFALGLVLSIGVLLHIQFIKRYRKNVCIWMQNQGTQLEEERKRIEKDSHERLNKMAGKLIAAQTSAITLYNYHITHKEEPFPAELNEVWNRLHDLIDVNKK